MKLSIIIPAYNEERTIGEVLKQIFDLRLGFDFEVIVVNDGSTDATLDKVKNSGFEVICLNLAKNMGKGAAIRRGIQDTTGDIILIQDADLEYSPQDYPALIQPILSGESKVVYGSRILKRSNSYSYKHFYWGGRLVSWWTNFLYGSRITDEPTCYKVIEASLLKSLQLKCRGFEFCPEVTAKLLKRGVNIKEVPISYFPRTKEDGKKISWRDGVAALWVLFILRFAKE
ncbi:MAG: glycosyltransferase family 2 protein [Candidatus Omnitrophota bacterium]|nr:glycosyltransferase family 2 protein [Candidatus Omnitrophota bacterium]MBU1928485.1 glycosyltransferase family 2 protein [Candidatus Omnitrophota bacterium]MBU2035442.1 glycosyltransferase family 2 protein [Candidatus Omnitrophota bacterium]MBU2257957.1 glycosyltransferase family 2 protein [Candidatus Omnitrophota bacterium]